MRNNADALATRPVWMFSVGSFGDHKPLIGPLMKREPKRIDDAPPARVPRFRGRHPPPPAAAALAGCSMRRRPRPQRLGRHQCWGCQHRPSRREGHDSQAPDSSSPASDDRLQNPVVRVLLRSPLRGPLANSLTLLSSHRPVQRQALHHPRHVCPRSGGPRKSAGGEPPHARAGARAPRRVASTTGPATRSSTIGEADPSAASRRTGGPTRTQSAPDSGCCYGLASGSPSTRPIRLGRRSRPHRRWR